MVYHLKNVVHVHPIRITRQEENLSGKTAFEWWAAMFGVQIKWYHAYNVQLYEIPLWGSIEDANQKINLCGIGSNSIYERQI